MDNVLWRPPLYIPELLPATWFSNFFIIPLAEVNYSKVVILHRKQTYLKLDILISILIEIFKTKKQPMQIPKFLQGAKAFNSSNKHTSNSGYYLSRWPEGPPKLSAGARLRRLVVAQNYS